MGFSDDGAEVSEFAHENSYLRLEDYFRQG